jgi:hypothetical protein
VARRRRRQREMHSSLLVSFGVCMKKKKKKTKCCFVLLGKYDDAFAHYKESLDFLSYFYSDEEKKLSNPIKLSVNLNAAATCVKLGKWKEAIKVRKKNMNKFVVAEKICFVFFFW